MTFLGNIARAGVRYGARAVIKAYSESGYVVPGMARRSMKGINVRANSPALDIDGKLTKMRALSRDFTQCNAIAVSILRRSKTNVIGAGLIVDPGVDRKFLNLSDAQADEWNDAAIREFDMWADSIESDYSRIATFNELQALMFLSSMFDGDVFFALPWAESNRNLWPYETCVKVIDADLVSSPNSTWMKEYGATDAKIRNGVEYNKRGQLEAFWVSNQYPHDRYSTTAPTWTRVPIYDDQGEQQIFHLLEHERVNQRRGLPMLAPVAENLAQASRLEKSELMSHLIASFFSVFIKDMSGMGGLLQEGAVPAEMQRGGGGDGPDDNSQEAKTAGHEWDYELGHGNVAYLDEDKEVQMAEPRKNPEFRPFFETIATQIAAAAEIPYEVVMLKFQESYSAMRGAIIEASKRWKVQRSLVRKRVCKPTYENVIREAVLKGRMPAAPGFFDDPVKRAAWCRASWIGPGSGYIDPLKEARASQIEIRGGQSTRSKEYAAKTGERWQPMVEQAAREKEKIEELGLDEAVEEEVINNEEDKGGLPDEDPLPQ